MSSMKQPTRKIILLALITLVFLIAAGALVWWNWSLKANKRAFGRLQTGVNYPLYFPERLPIGYKIDIDTLSSHGGTVVYALRNANQQTLAVTEQAYPKDFDEGSLHGNEEFTTNLGKAKIVTFDDRTTASLVAGKTWILINFPGSMDAEDLKVILRGYQPLTKQ